MTNRTAKVGAILEGESSIVQDQNLHIGHFYLLLGTKLLGKHDEIIAALGGTNQWETLAPKWPQLLFSTTCPKISPFETERQREERLNQAIRMLLPPYADSSDPSNPPHFIVSRACEYKIERVKAVKHSLSTREIENILRTPSDEHLDYFYLMITQHNQSTSSINIAPHIPVNWKALEPEAPWPLKIFISYFPKKLFETERQREWRLNNEVRVPLKEHLRGLLKQKLEDQGIPLPQNKLVSIIITRVCTYTNM